MSTDRPVPAVVVTLAEVDVATADELRSELATAVKRHLAAADARSVPLTIDLSAVTFLDSTGLGAILDADRAVRAAGGRLELVGLQPTVRRVLEVTGVWDHLQAAPPPPGGPLAQVPWHRGLR